jgi:hypothetical protein
MMPLLPVIRPKPTAEKIDPKGTAKYQGGTSPSTGTRPRGVLITKTPASRNGRPKKNRPTCPLLLASQTSGSPVLTIFTVKSSVLSF